METTKYESVPQTTKSEGSESKDLKPEEESTENGYLFPKRFILALLLFSGWFVIYCLRVCLSVAIVAMTNNATKKLQLPNTASYQQETFDWDPRLQGVILSSFYYGYIVLQIPGGLLALKFGGQRVFSIAILLASALTLLTPVLTNYNVILLIALRIIEGLCLGVNASSSHTIWSKWAPVYERSALITFSGSGCTVGSVVALSLSGILAGSSAGWPSVFYFFGGLGFFWFILFRFLAYESPDVHPTISKSEIKHIGEPWVVDKSDMIPKVPWKEILRSGPVWAIIVGGLTCDWAFYTILICIPLYLKNVMNFNIEETGMITALPYLVTSIIHPLSGIFADYLRKSKILSTTAVRKIFYSFGMLGSCTILVSMGYTQDQYLAVVLLIVSVGFQGTIGPGIGVNHVDISPKYAGVIMGISNMVSTLSGILSPLVVGLITPHESIDEWRRVFGISAAVSCLGVAFFLALGSGEKQKWADE